MKRISLAGSWGHSMLFFLSVGAFFDVFKTRFWAFGAPPFCGFSGKFPSKFVSFFAACVRAFFFA